MTRLERAKQKSIKLVLAQLGYTPEAETGSVLMYKSMLPGRFENNASLIVRKDDNTFKDYGLKGKSMDVIDLISEYKSISIKEAIDFLLSDEIKKEAIFVPPPKKDKPNVVIHAIRDIISPQVYDYLAERKISPHRARIYCKEVDFMFPYGKHPEKIYVALGFQNNSMGWEIRSGFFKIATTPKDVTTITGTELPDEYMVFEGFFNLLAALEIAGVDRFRRTVIVLNSASFVASIAVFLSGKKVYAYPDNDDTGDLVVDVLRDEGAEVIDCRGGYEGFNDTNDKLMNKPKKDLVDSKIS